MRGDRAGRRLRIEIAYTDERMTNWDYAVQQTLRTGILIAVSVVSVVATAQMPVAELPRVRINTSWDQPTGGKTWNAHTSEDFSAALAKSNPGDVIVLDAGASYVGKFEIPAKNNPEKKWIYIVSSAIAKLPEGKRVGPSDAPNMPRLITTSATPVLLAAAGANHWRLAGLEVTSESKVVPRDSISGNGFTYLLIGSEAQAQPMPDSITVDRCFIHGSPVQDIKQGVQANASNYAVVDSCISDIHAQGMDSQAVLAFDTPGPIKLANNYLEAAGENVMFGGSGRNSNRGVPSDIEIRNNNLFKPLDWAEPGISLRPNPKWVVKNAFELKSARRVLFDGNVIENVWAAAQSGFAVLLTVRTSQSGDFAVVSDVTITNNILKNVVSGFGALAKDDECGGPVFEKCQNAGAQENWYIANNLILFYDPNKPGGYRNIGLSINGGFDRMHGSYGVLQDLVFQHNTMASLSSSPCRASLFFGVGRRKPPFSNITDNIWVMDNVLCRPPTGDFGLQGTGGLTQYMGDSSNHFGLDKRFYGNVIPVYADDRVEHYPSHNLVTSKQLRWVDPTKGDYDLAEPKWTQTTDGKPAGVNSSALPQMSVTVR